MYSLIIIKNSAPIQYVIKIMDIITGGCDMEKTYKCRNGHKFKKQESDKVLCPTCNEPAEQVKWKNVDEFNSTKDTRIGDGIKDGIGSVVRAIKDGFK
jgi:hypothetical protein